MCACAAGDVNGREHAQIPQGNIAPHVTSIDCIQFAMCPSVVGVFMSLQHLWSYQYGYRLVTVHTRGDFIVLLHTGGNNAASTVTRYPTQLDYHGTA